MLAAQVDQLVEWALDLEIAGADLGTAEAGLEIVVGEEVDLGTAEVAPEIAGVVADPEIVEVDPGIAEAGLETAEEVAQ